MARVQRVDRQLSQRIDEIEQKMQLYKIGYEKYFSGIDPIEPMRQRDELRRLIRGLHQVHITNATQKHRVRNARARFNTIELWVNRNLTMIERGTHPKFRFRADLKARRRAELEATQNEEAQRREAMARRAQREDAAYQQIYNQYIQARRSCGQSTDLAYESVKKTLRNQVRTIKSRYRCNSVSFRVTVEEGKARLKAVPKR